jgi:hypothetical protein
MSRRRRKPITFDKIDHFGFVLPTVQSAIYIFTFAINGVGGPHSRTRIGKFASRQRLPFARLRCAGSRSQTSPQRPATSLAPRGRERLPTGERCLMGVDHSPPPWQSCARQPGGCRDSRRRPLLGRADLPSCRIESPDGKLAPRQRTSFVAVHGCKPPSHVGKDRREFLRPLRLGVQAREERPQNDRNRASNACKLAGNSRFRPQLRGRLVIGIADCTGEKGTARVTHAAQINLCFCDSKCEFMDFSVSGRTCNLAREFLDLLRRHGIGKDGETESMATRVSGRASSTLGGLRSGAGTRIRAVGPDLALAGHAALFPSADFGSSMT